MNLSLHVLLTNVFSVVGLVGIFQLPEHFLWWFVCYVCKIFIKTLVLSCRTKAACFPIFFKSCNVLHGPQFLHLSHSTLKYSLLLVHVSFKHLVVHLGKKHPIM